MINILGIDPGKATGVFVLHIDEFDIPNSIYYEGKVLEPGGVLRYADTTLDTFCNINPDASRNLLSVESFLITSATGKKSQQSDALEIIGQLKTLPKKYPVTLSMQGPGLAKKVATNKRLKKLGFFHSGHENRHINDAARHAIVPLLNSFPNVLLNLLECDTINPRT